MKKILYIFMALCAMTFTSCSDESEMAPAENNGIKFRVNVNAPNGFGSNTRALLKQKWEAGDQILVFLENVEDYPDNYLTLTYNAGSKDWTASCSKMVEMYLLNIEQGESYDCTGVYTPSGIDFGHCVVETETYDDSDSNTQEKKISCIIPEAYRSKEHAYWNCGTYVLEDDNVISMQLSGSQYSTQFRFYDMPEELIGHQFSLELGGVQPLWFAGVYKSVINDYWGTWMESYPIFLPNENEKTVDCQFVGQDLYCWYCGTDGKYGPEVDVLILYDLTTGKKYAYEMIGSQTLFREHSVKMSFADNFVEFSGDFNVESPEWIEFGEFGYGTEIEW